jgi:carboxyl-terminal processing protease
VKRITRVVAVLMVTGMVWVWATAADPAVVASRTETAAPAVADAKLAAEADRLCQAGIVEALAGRYDEARKQLQAAAKLSPDVPTVAEALTLLQQHAKVRRRSEAERLEEYEEAVRRVEYCRIAQAYRAVLTEKEIAKPLRDKARAVVLKYDALGKAEALGAADEAEAGKLRDAAVEAVKEAKKSLPDAVKVLSDDDSKYAKTFREIADSLTRRLGESGKFWASVDLSTPKSRGDAADTLQEVQADLAAAMANLEMMTIDKPWQVALTQGRTAAELSIDRSQMKQKPWYRTLVKEIEQLGARSIEKAEWHDAMSAFMGLDELDEQAETYKEKVKAVRRHVRVLRLYGAKPADEATTKPEALDDPAWKAYVAGVDAEMIRAAISRLHAVYVTSVDYRDVTRGALESVRILAETPQAANSFEGLSDEDKRKEFLDAVRREAEYVEKKDRVDQVELTLALNNLIEASEGTVQIPTSVLAVEFADGFLSELDRFSSMIWPNDVDDFRKHTMGQFYGVGIQITKDEGKPLRVVTPLPDTPAYKKGIKTNDLILKVDGLSTTEHSVDKLVRRITGKKGTKVVLTIQRAGVPKPFDVELYRDEINIRTVKGWRQLPDGDWDYMIDSDAKIGYIRITQFTDTTPTDMADALEILQADGMKSLIIDLRFNPGGLLRAAANVADEFLQAGRIVSTRGRQVRPTEINARKSGKYLAGDMAVLINQHSASAAEIVSGAIKDWQRGLVIGHRTFGKGSVQNVIPIRTDRAFLKLTTAYYYLPSGRLLHKRNGEKDWGVDPDVDVPITPKQMRRWLEVRRKTDLLTEGEPDELNQDLAKQYDADLQLNTAVLLLKLRQMRQLKPAA